MTTKWNTADIAHSAYLSAVSDTKIPIDDREVLFQNMEKIAIRTVNSYECTKASKQAMKDARGFLKKITGSSVRIPRLEGDIPDPNYVSNSQQSYIKLVEHLEQLILLYKNDANYNPNENFLKTASLDTLLADMKLANGNIDGLIAKVDSHRATRNHALYDIGPGIIDCSIACKKYVRSAFGPKSDEAISVTSIPLKRIMITYPLPE